MDLHVQTSLPDLLNMSQNHVKPYVQQREHARVRQLALTVYVRKSRELQGEEDRGGDRTKMPCNLQAKTAACIQRHHGTELHDTHAYQ